MLGSERWLGSFIVTILEVLFENSTWTVSVASCFCIPRQKASLPQCPSPIRSQINCYYSELLWQPDKMEGNGSYRGVTATLLYSVRCCESHQSVRRLYFLTCFQLTEFDFFSGSGWLFTGYISLGFLSLFIFPSN